MKIIHSFGTISLLFAVFLVLTTASDVHAQESTCFSAVADTYVRQFDPNSNFGGDTNLRLFRLDANADRALTYLRFDLSTIPSNALINNATLGLWLMSASAETNFSLSRVTTPWQEFSLTWNTRPGSTGSFDNPTHSMVSGYKYWNAVQPVSDWVSGASSNYGFLIASGLLDGPNDFSSREGPYHHKPELCVDWTVGATTDLVVTGMEVTQAVQDLNNSVPLIAGKRTFVRLYARGTDKDYRTFAQLAINCDQFGRILHPINNGNGYTVIKTSPDRLVLNDAFLFELPSDCTDEAEQIQILGQINPVGFSRGEYPPESDVGNNVTSYETFTFESVPPLDLKVRLGKYDIGDTSHTTSIFEAFRLRTWLLQAYPISDITMVASPIWLGEGTAKEDDGNTILTDPDSAKVNSRLRKLRKISIDENGASSKTIHYGMLSDAGGFMRGSASKPVGSGPTGSASWGWDFDGSYGDWYGGHEIGHALRRSHVNCNGKEDGPDSNYPHSGGLISGTTTGNTALFGFDANPTPTVYGPNWSDVMSYCPNQWISDYTYKAIKNEIQGEFSGDQIAEKSAGLPVADNFLVSGRITNGQATIDPVFLYPDVSDPGDTVPGDYTLVLRAQNGTELARKAFTPTRVSSGTSPNDGSRNPAINSLLFEEWLPFVTGAREIQLEGPSGLLDSIEASNNAPSVQLTVPNGPTTISGAGIRVQWTASDSNADDIWFNVEFSSDNGANWTMLATDIYDEFLEVDRDSLMSTGGANGLFRVSASDGFYTSRDQSDAAFTVATQAPVLEVISPQEGQVLSANQTLNLQANAWSDLAGVMDDGMIRWVSTEDGLLGMGDQVSVTGLTPGTHVIAIVANDGTRSSSTTRTINVVDVPGKLPQLGLGLAVSPAQIPFRPDLGMVQANIYIDNQSGTNPMAWQAAEFISWLSLNQTSGTTPASITATVNADGLAFGDYSANILILSSDIPGGGSRVVKVSFSLYAPNLLFNDGFE